MKAVNFFSENETIKTPFLEGLHTVKLSAIVELQPEQRVDRNNEIYTLPERFTLTIENGTNKERFTMNSNEYSTHKDKLIAFLMGIKETKQLEETNANRLLNTLLNGQQFQIVKTPFETTDTAGNPITRYTFRTNAELINALKEM